jgi:outer membrane protein OmpA-like peptidoglycan-associated protein
MRTHLVTSIAFAILSMAGLAFAQQQDSAGCKDHPMFSRMPNYVLANCEDQEFSTFDFTIGETTKKVEGHLWRIDFAIREGAKTAGPLQIGRNYWNAMAGKGGKRILEQLDSGGGTMVATLPGEKGGLVWLQVDVANSGEMYTLIVVREEAMRQDVELTVRDLADALAASGKVTLNNILFDTGKATLKPESDAQLKTVVALLKGDPSLKLEIQGHTDNVGGKEANLKLSKERADAVKANLVKGGIAAARLTTAGFGDTQPVTDNKSEEGRAGNRRVVLVRKS